MVSNRASASLLLILALLGAGGVDARAQGFGYRFGWWGGPGFGPHVLGPDYAAPRYDGPPPPDDEPPRHHDRLDPAPDAFLGPPPGARRCYSPEETRQRVAEAKLRPPYEMMRKASQLTRAEALAGKLCRWGDRDIYEIRLLAQDGALLRVTMDASTGQVLGGGDR